MEPFLSERFGNPSSPHAHGQEAARAVDAARRRVASLAGGPAGAVVFTGSGTEAVLLGVAGAARARRPHGGHVVLSAIEHTAALDAGRLLESQGFEVSRLLPDSLGGIDPEAVDAALRSDTALVSVLHANNETGVIQPVAAIAARCRARGVLFHVDAVQSAGKIPVSASAWEADLVSLAAHKIGGPPGVGALWRRRGIPLAPLIPGTQEGGLRGGTHNLPGIVGFGAAAVVAESALPAESPRITALRTGLEAALAARVPEAVITAETASRLPNTVHLTFDPRMGSDLVVALDLLGFSVSAGSACRSGAEEPSHVLLAMGFLPERARTAVRVSLGPATAETELEAFVDALARVVASRASSGAAR